MTRFNTSAANTRRTTNLAGGSAHTQTPELTLVSALLTSFLEDKFYQSGKGRMKTIIDAFANVDPLFAAKAAIYARNEFGMRSVSHVVAGQIAGTVKGEQWTKDFFNAIVHRPDDMTEILAYYYANFGKNEPQALRKGFATALDRFDEYQLAKYRGEGKAVKLVDVVNVVHPRHTEAIAKLVRDELRQRNTWEAKISEAGKSENSEAKAEAWAGLIKSGRIGYFALLRNLRNIIEESPESLDKALTMLTDEKLIKQSLVLPFRFLTAASEIENLPGRDAKRVLVALNEALDKSCANVPRFDGETLVAVDRSGSMMGPVAEKAALFGAILAKSNLADIILWSDGAGYLSINAADSVLSIARQILNGPTHGGGTNIMAPFQEASLPYDRIVILTDEQSWAHGYYGGSGPSALADYRQRTGANPFVYDWDLQGYGSLQFPENQVAVLAGWSEKVFDIMKLCETDKRALVNTIKKVSF